MRKRAIYAIYRGDNFLFMGTKKECAKYLGVEETTFSFYATPSCQKRREKAGLYNYIIVIRVEDDEE